MSFTLRIETQIFPRACSDVIALTNPHTGQHPAVFVLTDLLWTAENVSLGSGDAHLQHTVLLLNNTQTRWVSFLSLFALYLYYACFFNICGAWTISLKELFIQTWKLRNHLLWGTPTFFSGRSALFNISMNNIMWPQLAFQITLFFRWA